MTDMDQASKRIDDFDFSLIADFFRRLDRQGPGSDEATRRALMLTGGLPAGACIADIGCGTGAQTLVLARETSGRIAAVDLLPEMLDGLRQRMDRAGFGSRVEAVRASMDDLPFSDGEFDLIWAEGSVYNIGYRRGLEYWRRFLQPGGCVALTEVSWLSSRRPAEIEAYWRRNYAETDTVAAKIAQMEQAGFRAEAHFVLPDECWTEHYYEPMAAALDSFEKEYAALPAAREFVARQREEIALYREYGYCYGYVFYIGRKI